MIKFWLDDLREAPDSTWAVAKNYQEAIPMLEAWKAAGATIDLASLDHDLGGDVFNTCQCLKEDNAEEIFIHGCVHNKTGRHVVEWMEANNFWPKYLIVHSWNPAGASRMAGLANKHTIVQVTPYRTKVC